MHRKRAYIQQRLSGHTPSHVSRAPRPGTRARAAPRDPCSRSTSSQGPAARTRSTGAEERAYRAPQIREVDARQPTTEHAPDRPTRSRGTREAHWCEALAAKTRQETVALRRPVLAPRPGTRARGARRHRVPRRAREAQARKNEPTEPRRSGRSMPDPSTPQTARRAHEAHEAHRCEALVAKTRQETVALSSAMSRAEEPAHRSKRQGTALVIHEDRSGRNAARRTRVGTLCCVSVHGSSRKAGRACAAAGSRRARVGRSAERGV